MKKLAIVLPRDVYARRFASATKRTARPAVDREREGRRIADPEHGFVMHLDRLPLASLHQAIHDACRQASPTASTDLETERRGATGRPWSRRAVSSPDPVVAASTRAVAAAVGEPLGEGAVAVICFITSQQTAVVRMNLTGPAGRRTCMGTPRDETWRLRMRSPPGLRGASSKG